MKKICTILFIAMWQLASAQDVEWIPFEWHEENFKGRHFEKAAMFIPVTFDNFEHHSFMQFDLGSDETFIYGRTVKPYIAELENKLDTTLPFWMNNKKIPGFKGVDMKLGTYSFGNTNIGYYKEYGTTSKKMSMLVGTIGTDIFRDKILVIDYPGKRICITDHLPTEYSKLALQPYKIKSGHIIITLLINGQPQELMFDTGSSLFALLTSEKNADQISDKTNVDEFKGYSWGKVETYYGRKTTAEIKMGQKLLDPTLVYYGDNIQEENEMLQIWGTTGNSFFLNNVVVIDFKNKLIGVY